MIPFGVPVTVTGVRKPRASGDDPVNSEISAMFQA